MMPLKLLYCAIPFPIFGTDKSSLPAIRHWFGEPHLDHNSDVLTVLNPPSLFCSKFGIKLTLFRVNIISVYMRGVLLGSSKLLSTPVCEINMPDSNKLYLFSFYSLESENRFLWHHNFCAQDFDLTNELTKSLRKAAFINIGFSESTGFRLIYFQNDGFRNACTRGRTKYRLSKITGGSTSLCVL